MTAAIGLSNPEAVNKCQRRFHFFRLKCQLDGERGGDTPSALYGCLTSAQVDVCRSNISCSDSFLNLK